MLNIDRRDLLIEALRPPQGYVFDQGIGTTFSLDLLTLLVAPLSLALSEVSEVEEALRDPILLLDGIQQYADSLTIFCQAGRIAVPNRHSYLYRFLEPMVVEVQAPRGGVFHPKVWLLRYLAADLPPLYRLLVLSRNLTFDNSWDLMVRLEGELAVHRVYAYARNHPLGDFIAQLPKLALRPVASRITDHVALLQDEVRRVDFEVPEPFEADALGFHSFGMSKYKRRTPLLEQGFDRVLVMSPFLSDGVLNDFTVSGEEHVLVSRAESLAQIEQKTLARFDARYVIDNFVVDAETESPESADLAGAKVEDRVEPAGLHAKLFILESGWYATWFLGSANATNAAFRHLNVEFMVELQGKRSKVGIDAVLGDDEDNVLRALLRSYEPPDATSEPSSPAEKLSDEVRRWLLDLKFHGGVQRRDGEVYDLVLFSESADAPPVGRYQVRCWPITQRRERGANLEAPPASLRFTGLGLLSLTPFIAFEVEAFADEGSHTLRFVQNVPLAGLPAERDAHLYGAIIADRKDFLRYLWLVLSGGEVDLAQWVTGSPSTARSGTWWTPDAELPLLERMVRALSRSPDKLVRITEIVEQIRAIEREAEVLPEGFDELWGAINDTLRRLE